MLFEFNYFWKLLLTVVCAWFSYAFVGFEFTTVTLLAVLLSFYYKKNNTLIV